MLQCLCACLRHTLYWTPAYCCVLRTCRRSEYIRRRCMMCITQGKAHAPDSETFATSINVRIEVMLCIACIPTSQYAASTSRRSPLYVQRSARLFFGTLGYHHVRLKSFSRLPVLLGTPFAKVRRFRFSRVPEACTRTSARCSTPSERPPPPSGASNR